jgi:hypothetical protein
MATTLCRGEVEGVPLHVEVAVAAGRDLSLLDDHDVDVTGR